MYVKEIVRSHYKMVFYFVLIMYTLEILFFS